jgi:hypothetical protein
MEFSEERVRVKAKFFEHGSVLAGTKQGSCRGFTIELILRGEHEPQAVAELARIAHNMCFTEDVLGRVVPIEARHVYNDEPLQPSDE